MKPIVTIGCTDYLMPSVRKATDLVELMSQAVVVEDNTYESPPHLLVGTKYKHYEKVTMKLIRDDILIIDPKKPKQKLLPEVASPGNA